MANKLVPMGHAMLDGSTATGVTDEALVDGDVVFDRHITVGRGPIGDIAASGDGIVVVNSGDDSLSLTDAAAGAVGEAVALAGEPTAVVTSDDRAYVITGSASQDVLSIIDVDSRAVVGSIPLACGVSALALSPDGKRVYAGHTSHDRVDVTVIDVVTERVGTITIGSGPAANLDALAVDATGRRLYAAVTDDRGSQLVVVDAETSRVQSVVTVGSPIRDIACAGSTAYVLTSDRAIGGAVHVIELSTNKVTDTVHVGGAPTQLVMSPDHARAYVVDYDRVIVLCTLSLEIVDSVSVGARPSCVALGADGARLYVADYSGAVSVYTVASTIEMLYTQFLATDPIALSVPRALEPVTA